jgi:hypothetical protein
MHTLARRRKGRSLMPAVVLAAFAVGGLLVLAARELGRSRRRARRRALLAPPPDESAAHPIAPPAMARLDAEAVDELRERPRPVDPAEAARILGLAAEALAALNIPVTRAPDGQVAYDSWEIVHWVEVRQTDPAGFEARIENR